MFEYTIICYTNIGDLINEVNGYLKKGWSLRGDAFSDNESYIHQVMIKPTNQTKEGK